MPMTKIQTKVRRVVHYKGERVVVLQKDKRLSDIAMAVFSGFGVTLAMFAWLVVITGCQFAAN